MNSVTDMTADYWFRFSIVPWFLRTRTAGQEKDSQRLLSSKRLKLNR